MVGLRRKILIIGTVPPPIGGVTIHVKRLCEFLHNEGVSFRFIDIKRNKYKDIINLFSSHNIIHLHTSNVLLRALLAIICRLFNKKLIITIHGNIGRYSGLKNLIERFTIRFTFKPIVINKNSLIKATAYNKRSSLVSAFIPPVIPEVLNEEITTLVNNIRNNYPVLFSTNAYNMSFDVNGEEIYQISSLLKIFSSLPDKALIISDPSSAYMNYFSRNNIEVPTNVIIIPYKHSYYELLKLIDVMLRITTTDGDSISLKEALYLNKPVIASDVVDRPKNVIVTDLAATSIKAILSSISLESISKFQLITPSVVHGGKEILEIYNDIENYN